MQWNFDLFQLCAYGSAGMGAMLASHSEEECIRSKEEYNLKASWLVPNSHEDMIPKTMVFSLDRMTK
jgi:hypothetical protein